MAKTVEGICKDIANINPAVFIAIRTMAQKQLDYNSPLKCATTKRQHELGRHNMNVIELLEKLHATLLNARSI